MGKTLLQQRSCHEVQKPSNPHLRKSLLDVHAKAINAYGIEHIGELVDDFPDSPWFAVTLGSAMLVAEYLGDTGHVRLKTFDHVDLVLSNCPDGANAVWAAIIRVAISNGLTSLGSIE